MSKNKIFISHANPEDNYFTEWLFAQLSLAGYSCWCDLENMYGGEKDLTEEIQNVITKNTCKFLLVFSHHTFTKEFVKDEFEFARNFSRKNKIKDFIYPLRIADVDFNIRIGLSRLNHFPFYPSWPVGLSKLLKRMHHDGIPKSAEKKTQIISSWVTNKFSLDSGIIPVQRKYYSNLWQINSLPESLYVFQYFNEKQAETIAQEDTIYPKIRHGNCIASFQKNIINICTKCEDLELNPLNVFNIPVYDILKGYKEKNFPTFTDAQNFLKRLLKKSLDNYLFKMGLSRHIMSGNQGCFFYKKHNRRAYKVKVRYPGGKTIRNLIGKYFNDFWHFGISFKVLLEPFICFSIKSHLIFTNDGYKKWEDENEMFKARRKKGRRMFNKEWRDLLIAMLYSLRNDEGRIILTFNDEQYCEMLPYTISFEADFDYIEPNKESRISLLIEDFSKDDDEEFVETEISEETREDDQ